MKPNFKNTIQAGFSLSELIVVIAIIGLLSTLVVVNFNQQRAQRSLVIAQNELVTNIRKTQSYALSSRKTSTGESPEYYLMNFYPSANYYSIASISNGNYYDESEIIRLSDKVTLFEAKVNGSITSCIQIIFAVPFGKTYIYGSDDVCDDSIMQVLADPIQISDLANRTGGITLTHPQVKANKSVNIYGLSGRIEGN
jgi:prepilin-type N-terminal cleavage/methylation domain-containing protein